MAIKKYFFYSLFFTIIAITTSSCLSRPERLSSTGYHKPAKPVYKNVAEKYSELIGVEPSELENALLYSYIDEWMGSPHQLGGHTKNGIDCSAFTNFLIQEVYGKSLPRTANDMAQVIKRKYENQLREGDLVFFNFNGKNFDHVGIYLRNNKFVHVSTSKGVIISDLTDPWYRKYFSRAGSIL
ncbi:MAG TPA: NlpC/P60 family protein [Sphingobacteriaceae bacterium]|nr:NlpC/P60 family protein [Sphingobacteriaceae bacterium]